MILTTQDTKAHRTFSNTVQHDHIGIRNGGFGATTLHSVSTPSLRRYVTLGKSIQDLSTAEQGEQRHEASGGIQRGGYRAPHLQSLAHRPRALATTAAGAAVTPGEAKAGASS